jgi:single-strand DNA-binding protein
LQGVELFINRQENWTMGINHFTYIGRVTKALELRYTPNGMPTVTYTVACNQAWYDDNGQLHEACDFVPITTIGRQAENDAKYLGKGSAVAVAGRIQSWYDPAKKRGGFNFKAIRVEYLGKPSARGKAVDARGNVGEQSASADGERCEWLDDYDRAEVAQAASRPKAPAASKSH